MACDIKFSLLFERAVYSIITTYHSFIEGCPLDTSIIACGGRRKDEGYKLGVSLGYNRCEGFLAAYYILNMYRFE